MDCCRGLWLFLMVWGWYHSSRWFSSGLPIQCRWHVPADRWLPSNHCHIAHPTWSGAPALGVHIYVTVSICSIMHARLVTILALLPRGTCQWTEIPINHQHKTSSVCLTTVNWNNLEWLHNDGEKYRYPSWAICKADGSVNFLNYAKNFCGKKYSSWEQFCSYCLFLRVMGRMVPSYGELWCLGIGSLWQAPQVCGQFSRIHCTCPWRRHSPTLPQ